MIVFDLDQTVVDSSHRTPMKNGKVDIDGYVSLQTKENIYRDTLLPLSDLMIQKYDTNYIVVCTARFMTDDDYSFLQDKKLRYHEIFERGNVPSHISCLNDAQYKTKCLNRFKMQNYTFYDDSDEVIDLFKTYANVSMIDSRIANSRLEQLRDIRDIGRLNMVSR